MPYLVNLIIEGCRFQLLPAVHVKFYFTVLATADSYKALGFKKSLIHTLKKSLHKDSFTYHTKTAPSKTKHTTPCGGIDIFAPHMPTSRGKELDWHLYFHS